MTSNINCKEARKYRKLVSEKTTEPTTGNEDKNKNKIKIATVPSHTGFRAFSLFGKWRRKCDYRTIARRDRELPASGAIQRTVVPRVFSRMSVNRPEKMMPGVHRAKCRHSRACATLSMSAVGRFSVNLGVIPVISCLGFNAPLSQPARSALTAERSTTG